jgi:DNA-binding NtrC family response regulator
MTIDDMDSSPITTSTLSISFSDEQLGNEARRTALTVIQSPDTRLVGTELSLENDAVVVGRDVDHGVSIRDNALSRAHFRVAFDAKTATHRVSDAGSRNGTFVNGRRVEAAPLVNGTVLRGGNTLLVYGSADPSAEITDKIASLSPSDISILLLGETGVGKEVLARRIHERSGRSGEFVAVNCATLPRELAAAELFGHVRGAFSGATCPRQGLFMAAAGGTILLDEVADCPPDVQPALLRALQEHRVRAVGSDRELTVDVRVLSATSANLMQSVECGGFRADLYSRLAEASIQVRPLRERRTEILGLAVEFALECGTSLAITPPAAEVLLLWLWPFNVRELRSIIRSFVAIGGPGAPLDVPFLRLHAPAMVANLDPQRTPMFGELDSVARSSLHELERLLEQHAGNVSQVAESLGKPRSHVYRALRALGLSTSRFRPARH